MLLLRHTALVLTICLLAACGFRPMYGDHGSTSVATEFSQIKVELIADRAGQQLHNFLLDRLNPDGQPQQPDYRLGVTLSESISKIATRRTGFSTRANLSVTANYALRDSTTDLPVVTGKARVISSYNILDADAEFSNLTSEQNARTRALESIADQIQTRLGTHFVSQPTTAAAPTGG